jgi:hypothetical protein
MKIAFFSMNPSFAGHILEELDQHHTVKRWEYNHNETIRWSNMMRLMDWCDLAYLEWIQRPNLELTQVQGLNKPLVAFCHGVDASNHSGVDWRNISGLIIQDALYPRLLDLRTEWSVKNPNKTIAKLPKKILIQSLGVDLRAFTPLPSPIPEYHIVTHSQWIRPVKRIYEAIQQFYDLIQLDEEKPWRMTLIGQWEGWFKENERRGYMRACRELIDQLKFPPGRFFMKPENFSPQIWKQFSKTVDVYWCTSYRESFGASMAEVCAGGGYPFINWYLGADKVYPKKYLCKTPGEMVKKTIEWGNLSPEEKIQERKNIRKHIEKYDAREAAKNIRIFLEEIQEGYRKG